MLPPRGVLSARLSQGTLVSWSRLRHVSRPALTMQVFPLLINSQAEETSDMLASLVLRLHILSAVYEAVASTDSVMPPGSFKVLLESSQVTKCLFRSPPWVYHHVSIMCVCGGGRGASAEVHLRQAVGLEDILARRASGGSMRENKT